MTRHDIGIDLIDIDRIVAILEKFPDRFRTRVLTEGEQRYCGRKVERIAGRWAAKEAISKVLGLGVRGVGWREIEILPNYAGAPQVRATACWCLTSMRGTAACSRAGAAVTTTTRAVPARSRTNGSGAART